MRVSGFFGVLQKKLREGSNDFVPTGHDPYYQYRSDDHNLNCWRYVPVRIYLLVTRPFIRLDLCGLEDFVFVDQSIDLQSVLCPCSFPLEYIWMV